MFYHTFIIYFCYFFFIFYVQVLLLLVPDQDFINISGAKKLSFCNDWFSWRCCSLIHKQIQIHSQALVLLGWNDRYRAASNWCSSGRKSYEWLEEERANKWTLRHLSALWYLEGLDTELDTVKKKTHFQNVKFKSNNIVHVSQRFISTLL